MKESNYERIIDWSLYDIYEDGRIYSKSYNYKRFLKGTLFPNGYMRVRLKCADGKRRIFMWHRVIWTYFNGDIPEGYQVNHIDENKQNNVLSNLNIMTCKENINHGTRTKRMVETQRNDINKSKPVVAVDKDGVIVMEFPSTCEAGRNGFDQGCVSACCRNCYYREGNRFFKGYYWYFKSDWLEMQKNASPHKREDA